MLYNNIDMSDFMRIIDIRGRGLTEQELTTVRVLGSDEDYVTYRTKPPRYLEIDYEIRAKNKEELRKKIDAVSAIIETTEKVPIIFHDEPDMTYYGEYAGAEQNVEYHHVGIHRGTIYILRDKYKYGLEKVFEPSSDTFIVENPGTAEAEPIFELEVLQDTTFAMVQNGEDEYMAIGRPYEEDEVPTSDRETILNDDASSLIGWSHLTGGSTLYNLGLVGGQMISNGYAFEPSTYGTNPNGWVGPAIKRSLSEELQDFELEIDIAMLNGRNGVGQTRILGLDADDRLIFSMGMVDGTASRPDNRALFGLGEGNATWFAYKGDHGINVWNDGRFMLRIRRRGEKIEAWIARKLDPLGRQLTGRHYRSYDDREGRHQRKLAQVVIYMAGARSYPHFYMYFHHLTVTKLINLADYEVPYIARVGDIITFDHTNEGDILINGEPRNDLKDFGGSFFTLNKGFNQLTVFPFETFNTKLRFRPRYR